MTENLFNTLISNSTNKIVSFSKMPFKTGSQNEKGELMSEILSLFNTIREETAYLIEGIEVSSNHQIVLHGISEYKDDANLQNIFDNTTPRIKVLYKKFEFQGKSYGIYEIPVEKYSRPCTVNKQLDFLKTTDVYIKDKSGTTKIASSKEIVLLSKWLKQSSKDNTQVEDTSNSNIEFNQKAKKITNFTGNIKKLNL